MATLDLPNLTGFVASLESGTIKMAGGRPTKGIKSISWKQELGGETVYGNGPIPVGETIGAYSGSVDVEQLMSEYLAFIRSLGNGYMLRRFNITLNWREGAQQNRIEIPLGRIKSDEGSASQGGGAVFKKYSITLIKPMKLNGISAIDEALLRGYNVSPTLLG